MRSLPQGQAERNPAPAYANSPVFYDSPSAQLATFRRASLAALAGPYLADDQCQAVAELLADLNTELADRATALVDADPWDLDLARLAAENRRLRGACRG